MHKIKKSWSFIMKLSDYVTSYLEKITDSIFLVSGGGCMHMVDSIGRSNLKSYCCHHEQGCALAAEGYARQKNDIGVISVTTGPGGTNAITGVASAWIDNIPMLVLSGQVRTEMMVQDEDKPYLRQIGPQELNIVDIVKPITKYAVLVKDPREIKYHLEKAHYLAKSGKPGPVWLDLPLDIQRAEIQEQNLVEFEAPKKQKTFIPLEEIVGALNKSKKPLMLVGQGVRLGNSIELLNEFIQKTGINVISAMSGDDLITEDYANYLGRQGITGTATANYAVDNCDLLLILGTRMQTRQTSFDYQNFAKNAVKIMVDIDPAELSKKTLQLDIPVCADSRDFLENILKQDINLQRWNIERKADPYPKERNPGYVDVYRFVQELSGKCNYPIITTNGMACEANHQAIRLKKGQRLITNTAFGEMGKGLPMAIGACVANSGKPVICMEGDGSMMMNMQELQTMRYHNLPLKIFLFNNGGYFSIRNTHQNYFNKVFAADETSGLSFPDWSKLAPAWGIKYESLRSENDLSKISGVLGYDGPVFCEVFISPSQKMLPKWSAK